MMNHLMNHRFTAWFCYCLSILCALLVWLTPGAAAIAYADEPTPTVASEVTEPTTAQLFETQCAGCHPNGANIIRRGKNLKQKALERNGYATKAAIIDLVTHGKGNMSAYGDRLSPEQIENLAQYVLDRAALNWKG
jgi:cytochrome c6